MHFKEENLSKVTIYLHGGTGKTGSSAIQNFLDVNRGNLYKHHACLYPNFNRIRLHTGRYHNHLEWYRKHVIKNDEVFLKYIHRTLKYCRAHSLDKVILSGEGWLRSRNMPPRIRLVLDNFEDVDVRLICYFRRMDSWFESAWKQWGLKEFETYEEYMRQPRVMYRFEGLLDSLKYWEKYIGRERMIVKAYEKQQLPEGLLSDFLSSVDIDYKSHEWVKNEDTNVALNMGFDRDVLEILHMSRIIFTGTHDNHLFNMFASLLGEKFQKKPFESYSILSPAERLEIIQKNLPFEQEIARRYMDREDGRLFYDPLPDSDEPVLAYEGLSIEKAIPIIIRMIESNYRQIQERNIWYQLKNLEILQPIRRLRNRLRGKPFSDN